jgi:hypothetical protein
MAFLIILGLVIGGMWIYFKLFAKPPCGCADKAVTS